MKIEISSRYDYSVLFSIEAESRKLAVEAAVKSGVDLFKANLSKADLSGADLSGANLMRASLSKADLSGADLSGANLMMASLSKADLSGADLSGADLFRADLFRANLMRTNLRGANLHKSNLSGADLRGAVIAENATVNREPLQLVGLIYPIIIWDHHMTIGCEFHSLVEWANFDDMQITAMDSSRALTFWQLHKDTLLTLAKSDGRE